VWVIGAYPIDDGPGRATGTPPVINQKDRSSAEKVPAQAPHDCHHEGFMMSAPIPFGGTPLQGRKVDENGKAPAQGVHGSDHEGFMMDQMARPLLVGHR